MTRTAHPETSLARLSRWRTWTLGVAALLLTGGTAAAQAMESGWEFSVTPYFMGTAMQGTAFLEGQKVEVDVPSSDLFSNLDFGFLGTVTARKGDWGWGAEAQWMTLKAPATYLPADLDVEHGAIALYGLRRLGAAVDVNFGLRVNSLRGNVAMAGVEGYGIDQSETWVDPLAGLTLRTTGSGPLGLQLYAEIGGLSVGSQLTWQVFPQVQVRLAKGIDLQLGYRWFDTDYATGDGEDEFRFDMLTQGPLLGITTRF